MAHTIYENFVLENKIEDMLTTAIDMNQFLTPDYSLTETAGMIKKIHNYSATGNVEVLAMGEGNTESIEVTFEPTEYEVLVTQGNFPYYDEQEMTDPMVVDVGLAKMSANMTNSLTRDVITELGKATLVHYGATWKFDDVVDAIAVLNIEDQEGLFLLISPAEQASFRKNLKDDLSYVEAFARTGYIGSVCGVPVFMSKAVPTGEAYLASREAVSCFVKKGVEIEQTRDADHRKNDIYARKVMLVALTDPTKVCKITSGAKPVTPPEEDPVTPPEGDPVTPPEGE